MRGLPESRRVQSGVFFKVTVLFISALALVVSCLLVFNMLFFRSATHDLSRRIRSQSHLSLELSVNNKLREYANMMYRIVIDRDLRGHLKQLDVLDDQAFSLAVAEVSQILQTYANASKDIIAVTAVSRQSRLVVYDRSRLPPGTSLWSEELALEEILQESQAGKRVYFLADDRQPDGRSMIHVVLGVWDFYTQEAMGAVIMTVDAATLWRLIGSGAAEPAAFDFLALADGRLLVHPDYSMTGKRIDGYLLDTGEPRLVRDTSFTGSAQLIPLGAESSVKKLEGFDVYLISVLDPGLYGEVITRYASYASFLVVCIALLFTVIYALVLRGLLRSVRQVVEGIERVRDGNLDVRIDIPPRDEIYYIAEAFNSTLESLATISTQRDQEFLRFLRESERRRGAEIRSLQSQINSHFLYNTLNVINYTALEGDSGKTSRMIKSLANCLRYTLDKHWDEVRVADEVQWLEQYLLLQKERQPSLFNYAIHVAGDAVALPIQKLIIQPFVENAILHGFTGCKTTRSLTITIRRLTAPERISIAIYDDGVGIPPDKLAEIRQLLRNYTKADSLGIGVENACFRLSMHYKAEARIFVRSRPGAGTKFNILLPTHTESAAQEPVPYSGRKK